MASLEDSAYEAVIGWLSRGEARPGEPLPLRELAKRLGMSRTPLRAAVGRLHEQGLVSYDQRLGFTVAMPTIADLYELFDLRLMCEVHALRRFFERPGAAVPPSLPELARDGAELAGVIPANPESYARFLELDAQLHQTIVALAGSERLREFYEQLNLRFVILRLGRTVPMTAERFETSAREHVAIVDAMEAGDAVAARERLEAHLLRVRDETVERLTRSLPVRG